MSSGAVIGRNPAVKICRTSSRVRSMLSACPTTARPLPKTVTGTRSKDESLSSRSFAAQQARRNA